MDGPQIRYLSLGWGVQSFTLAAMMALEALTRVDIVIHADTAHESELTYRFAQKWTPWLGEHGITVVTVQGKRTDIIHEGWGKRGESEYTKVSVTIPAFTKDKANGKPGQIRRQCTEDWKITPIRQYVRSLLPKRPRPDSVEAWMGISWDEMVRMRSSDVKYIVNKYPLVERRMTRSDCIAWLGAHGLEIPPKSACVFCPYHSLNHWKELKRRSGMDWQHALDVDKEIRERRDLHTLYVHPSREPLEEGIRIPEDYGIEQLGFEFDQPCDGGTCFV